MVKPKQVGHLVINVSDVAASTKFYTEILGFEIAVSRPTATFLTCGEIHHDLALFQASDDSRPPARATSASTTSPCRLKTSTPCATSTTPCWNTT